MAVTGFDDRKQHRLDLDGLRAPPTQAADGLPRRRFSVADAYAMVEAGILREKERVELIGGEFVVMNPKGIRHEMIKTNLLWNWIKLAPDDFRMTPETTFKLDDYTFVEPDVVIYSRDTGIEGLNGDTGLLAVEIADSSWAYDTGRKMQVYAQHGVRELWVINVNEMIVRVHLGPDEDAYGDVRDYDAEAEITPRFAAPFTLRLADLTA